MYAIPWVLKGGGRLPYPTVPFVSRCPIRYLDLWGALKSQRDLNWLYSYRKDGANCALQLFILCACEYAHLNVATYWLGWFFPELLVDKEWGRKGQMDGRMEGWMQAGKQNAIYHKEGCYHKYSKCPAINHWLGAHNTGQKHKLNKTGFGCFPVPGSIFSDR